MPMTLKQQRAWNVCTQNERKRDFIIEDERPPKYTSNEPVPVYLPPHLQSHKWYLDGTTGRLFNPFDWHFYHDFTSLQLLYQRNFINAEDVCSADARRLSKSPRCAPNHPHSWNDEQKDWWLRIYWQKYQRELTIKRNTAFREFLKVAEIKNMHHAQVLILQAQFRKQAAKRGRDEDEKSAKPPAGKKFAIVDATGQQIAVKRASENTQAKNSESQEPKPDEHHMRAQAEYLARNHLIPCPDCSVIHRKSRPVTGRLNKSPKVTPEPCICTDSETCMCNKEAGTDAMIPAKKRYWYDYNGQHRNIVVPASLNPPQITNVENGPRQNPKHWSLKDRDAVRSKSLKSKNKPVVWWNLIGIKKVIPKQALPHPLTKVMNFGEVVEEVRVLPRLQKEASFASTITATEDGENSDDDDAMEGVVSEGFY